MSATEFLVRAAAALKVDPPHGTDLSQLARIARLGIVPGRDFDATRYSTDELADIEAGVKAERAAVMAAPKELAPPVNGWISVLANIGVYGNDYLRRSAITLAGLGANPPEDAIYPLLAADADGKPLDGDTDYVIHFDAGELPPVAAFWSVTMYDDEAARAVRRPAPGWVPDAGRCGRGRGRASHRASPRAPTRRSWSIARAAGGWFGSPQLDSDVDEVDSVQVLDVGERMPGGEVGRAVGFVAEFACPDVAFVHDSQAVEVGDLTMRTRVSAVDRVDAEEFDEFDGVPGLLGDLTNGRRDRILAVFHSATR